MANNENFKISNFIGVMAKDGLRQNQFIITLPGTDGTPLSDVDNSKVANFKFKAEATTIPGMTLGRVGAFYFGRQVTFAGNQAFGNWGVNIIMDEDDYKAGGIRYYFEEWIKKLNDNVNNIRDPKYVKPDINGSEGYMRDGWVTHLSKTGEELAKYKMKGCFPVGMSPIELNWGANENIVRFSVEFSIQYWERILT